jgi:molybdopterin/thiamine biosynthesis adenylyltransferase
MNRHGRQTRLAEVGSTGQASIGAAEVQVGGEGIASLVAARYLAGAGVGAVRVRSATVAAAIARVDSAIRIEVDADLSDEIPDDAFDLRDPAARSLAIGARTALDILRGILEARSPGGRS